ncbi:MAG: sensor histidine kinase [Pseudomonadota bacterium]
MTGAGLSLRARLTAIILVPLVIIGAGVGFWAVLDARERADVRFDRSLLSAALAVSRDVAVSGGDALTAETNAILADSFGGPVFYHVYAPDGVFVTGYATPPIPVTEALSEEPGQQYYTGVHQSRAVRAIRFVDTMQVDGLSGRFTFTVWQDQAFLNALVGDLVRGTLFVILLLVVTVALVVWFGVRYGLRPLNDLEDAIAARSTDELHMIRRKVPVEVTGIVRTLNSLFDQLAQSMAAQADFISNAAHQLRNPIAGVLSMAEAVDAAPTDAEARRRSRDLLDAARHTSDLTQKLLLLERAKAISPGSAREAFDLSEALETWLQDMQTTLPAGVVLTRAIADSLNVHGDPTMLREAVVNLINNAARHGGPTLSEVKVIADRSPATIRICVQDNGRGIPPKDIPRAFQRFEDVGATSGSGLGVSIVDAVARSHGGALELTPADPGLRATVTIAA